MYCVDLELDLFQIDLVLCIFEYLNICQHNANTIKIMLSKIWLCKLAVFLHGLLGGVKNISLHLFGFRPVGSK